MDYFILAILWILWCAVHSGMISLTVTDFIKKKFPRQFRFYRLFFNLVAFITVFPVVLYSMTVKAPVVLCWEGYMMIFQGILLVTGVLLFIAGARHYDLIQLMGIRQIKTGNLYNALSETGGLDTTGILGVIRHPWYLGTILVIWSGFRKMSVSIVIINVILTVYLVVGTILEDRKLVVEYGDAYRSYQERVSMLIPVKWIKQFFYRSS